MPMKVSGKALLCALLLFSAASCGETYSWKKDLEYRTAVDFSKDRAQVTEYIRKYIPDVSEAQIDAWTASGELESAEVGGVRKYFKNAAPNLFRTNPLCRAIKEKADGIHGLSGKDRDTYVQIPEILSADTKMAAPRRMRVKYTLRVKAGVVPDGETVRCWLPYPRKDIPRQSEVKFIKAGAKSGSLDYFDTADPNSALLHFSDSACAHSTLYMEIKARKDLPVTFFEEFEYTSSGEYNRDIEKRLRPYDTSRAEYRKYTAEREKHVIFSPTIKSLADSLTAGITNPYLQAKAMFRWICENIPWASARDYSTIENIPEYVLKNRRGDCGQVSLLFITMCRYKGIPARFESGFMMHPHERNLHDWAEIYFEGVGWVPVDQSFGIPSFADDAYLDLNPGADYFYLGAIDSWRMVVNNDFGMDLDPEKKYPRSDMVDFQRGEVEWKKSNLYYPMWDWDMDVTYL